jgi:prepilin-type N-terminal cleavage/methylation domain-containing protein
MQGHRHRAQDDGFTLVELLAVMLILGVLAAIALTVFVRQGDKAKDAEAKALASQLYKHVESCFAETGDYRRCETGDPELRAPGLSFGTGVGEVRMTAPSRSRYTAVARSATMTRFSIVRDLPGAPTKECDVDAGGCRGTSW